MKGLIVNGAYRDVAQAREENFPLYAKAVAPYSGPKRGPFEINVPVCCGGVNVQPGDVVVCDEEGGVVIPRAYAAAVAEALREYEFNPDLAAWQAERGELHAEGFGAQARRYVDLFQAQGGIYVDAAAGDRS